MKKKAVMAGALALTMLFLSACGGNGGSGSKDYSDEVDAKAIPQYEISQYAPAVEGHFTEAPCYALPESATEDEVRAMAVKAMNDELTFKWAPLQSFEYKDSAGASRNLVYDMTQIYGGIPYNNKARSLFHCLEWYDYETGYMYGLDYSNKNLDFGNTCANSVIWGLAAVCPGITAVSTHTVTPGGGFSFVADVKGHDDLIKLDTSLTTYDLIQEVGEAETFRSYSIAKPADALLKHIDSGANSGNHCMMVTGVNTVMKADGTIDPEASTMDIQDQWGKLYTEDNVGYCGRHKNFTFQYLLDEGYFVFRAKEFVNYSGHEVSKLTLSNEPTTFDLLKKTKINCNYRITGVYGSLVSESGTTVAYKRVSNTNYTQDQSTAAALPTASDMLAVMKKGRNYTVKVEVRIANGELLTVAEVPVTIEELQ